MSRSEDVPPVIKSASLTGAERKALTHLKVKVMEGAVALFMGAGSSLESGAPSGKDLIDLIRANFSDIDFTGIGDNMLDICQEIEDCGRRRELDRFIMKTFYGLKPNDALLALPQYLWPVIYTTNYDDLIEKAFEEYYQANEDTAKMCKPLIGDLPQFLGQNDEVLLFKLMGDAKRDDPDESMILTRGDYNRQSPNRRKKLDTFSTFAHDGSVLYVGYSFKDRIVYDLIDELQQLFKIQRDDSFALIPNFERGSKIEKNLVKRHINPLPLTLEEFVEVLKKEIVDISPLKKKPRSGITVKLEDKNVNISYRDYKEFSEYFTILSEEEIQKGKIFGALTEEERIEAFLKGQSDDWVAFKEEWDFKRDIYSEILSTAKKEVEKNRPEKNDAILILGEGGLGKSVLLKRLAYDLYKAGTPVLILQSYSSFFDYKLIEKFCEDVNRADTDEDKTEGESEAQQITHKVAIILDNAAANVDNIKKILTYLKNHSRPAVIICAARLNEWAHALSQWGYRDIIPNKNTFRIPPKMNGLEVMRLLKHLGKILHRQDFSTNEVFWMEKAVKDYDMDFFAMIYSLLDPARRRLDDIIWDEYQKLPSEPTKRAYEYVCLFYQYDMPLNKDLIVNALNNEFGYSYADFTEEICEREAKSLIIGLENNFRETALYRAKSKIIAQKIVEKLFNPSNSKDRKKLFERYKKVLLGVKALNKTEVSIARALLILYLGPNGIDRKKIDDEQLIELYDSLLDHDVEDSSILHHYGILESDRGDFKKAEYLLNYSLQTIEKYGGFGFGSEHENYVYNSLGVLYAKEALKHIAGDINKSIMYSDNADLYFKSSKIGNVTSPHPYHSQANFLIKKGEYYDNLGQKEEAYRYYSEALEVLGESKESLADYDLTPILDLESGIYTKKIGDLKKAEESLKDFIQKYPNTVSGRFILSGLFFNAAKELKDPSAKEKNLKSALSIVDVGLKLSERNLDLLRLKYYITKELEPENNKKLCKLLFKRYNAFEGNCFELRLLFDLGVILFELEKYNESKAYFRELSEKSKYHPNRSGTIKICQTIDGKDKIFKGYYLRRISYKEAYISTEEIGYPLVFSPIAQKRKLIPRQDVEFKVAFNYRGILATQVRPL
jgi:tetratricopeptide (TPR) repeat protein